MSAVLVGTLAAPLASWGVGGAARRPSDLTPTASAVLGMVGAALGLARGDERLDSLQEDYALATQTLKVGHRIEDYHTVSTPHGSVTAHRRLRTRADELECRKVDGSLWTSQTWREYICDGRWRVVLWCLRKYPTVAPAAIADACRRPAYLMYLGRKSCPLSQPFLPELTEAAVLSDALSDGDVRWDLRIPPGALTPHSLVTRGDALLSASRRTFASRQEAVS